MDPLIGTRLGPYNITELIGEGGIAIVYKGFQEALHRYVALKVLRDELARDQRFVERFQQEVLAAANLNHPNIVHVFDAGAANSKYFVAMAYVDGGTLKDMILQRRINPERAVSIAIQLAEALDQAHKQGLIHRDVKPNNVLMTRDGRPLLTDFGIAKALYDAKQLTRTGTSIGTPEYMAPEQAQGRTPDGRTDIYALGIVLYEMLASKVPFCTETPVATMYMHVHEPLPPLRQADAGTPSERLVPAWLENVVCKALAKDPADRYATAGLFAAALRQGQEATRTVARSVTPAAGAPAAIGPAAVAAGVGRQEKTPTQAKRTPMLAPECAPAEAALPTRPPRPRGPGLLARLFRRRKDRRAHRERSSQPRDETKSPARTSPARGTPLMPTSRLDNVHFSLTSLPMVCTGIWFPIDVWAHLEEQRSAVIRRAQEATGGAQIRIKSKGPVEVARGTILSVRLEVQDLIVEDPEDDILWTGDIGTASFAVMAPKDLNPGPRRGLTRIYANGMQIARLYFEVVVGDRHSEIQPLKTGQERLKKAFASYSSVDREAVLARVHGMEKAAPHLDVFVDVLSLRSGQDWEQELTKRIPLSDVFYLFWSGNARRSEWVEKEWRCALTSRGIDFIDPVPLVPPELAPPPPELASLHFNDRHLAFMRYGR